MRNPSAGPEGIFPSGNRFLRRRHVVGDLKHRIQAGQFKDPHHRIAGRGEDELLALLARLLKPFEKAGDAGTVDHGHAGQIDDDGAGLAEDVQKVLAHAAGMLEVDVALQGNDGDFAFFND